MWAPYYSILIISMTVLGMLSTIRSSVLTTWLYESMKKKHFTTSFAVGFLIEGVIGLMIVYYFLFISNDWFGILLTGLALQVLGSIGFLFILESPMQLIKSGQIVEA